MRISALERESFIRCLSKHITQPAELMLFGSRIDDNAKGGDIDLLLLVNDNKQKSEISFNKAEILSQIKSEIGDQKIDLIISTRADITTNTFLQSIIESAISLKKW